MKWFTLLLITASPLNGFAFTLSDFDLQMKLENFYTSRMKQKNPDTRFVIMVEMHPLPNSRIDSLKHGETESQLTYGVEKRQEKVTFMSEDDFDHQEIAETLGVPLEKMVFLKLQKKVITPAPTAAPPPPLSFHEEIRAYFAHPSGFFQGIQAISFGVIALLVFFGMLLFSGNEPKETRKKPRVKKMKSKVKPLETSFQAEQVVSMFAECYWTHHDAEGSAIIRTFSHHMHLFKSLRFGKEYIEFLKSVEPGSLDFTKDAYYLDPYPVFHELSVADTPVPALLFCSRFRVQAKNADISQILMSQKGESPRALELEPKQSELRHFKRPLLIEFKTIEEEDAILSHSDIPEEMKLRLSSLYRLFRLDPKGFKEITDEFTAKQLAEAWVAPEWLLSAMEQKLDPAKKKALRKARLSYTGSRDSEVFKTLVEKASRSQKVFPFANEAFRQAA